MQPWFDDGAGVGVGAGVEPGAGAGAGVSTTTELPPPPQAVTEKAVRRVARQRPTRAANAGLVWERRRKGNSVVVPRGLLEGICS